MMKDNNSAKKWRIKILSICLSAILLVSIIVTTVCVTVLNKENVVFTELKLSKEKTVEEYSSEVYKNEQEIKRLAGKQYFAIKLSLENAELLKQQAQRIKENAELLEQQAQMLLEQSENNKKDAEQLKQQALKAQQASEKAQKEAQEAEKRAQLAREEADQKLKEANDIRIEKLEIQNMINKKMIELSNSSIVNEKSISPTEVKQNIEND